MRHFKKDFVAHKVCTYKRGKRTRIYTLIEDTANNTWGIFKTYPDSTYIRQYGDWTAETKARRAWVVMGLTEDDVTTLLDN